MSGLPTSGTISFSAGEELVPVGFAPVFGIEWTFSPLTVCRI